MKRLAAILIALTASACSASPRPAAAQVTVPADPQPPTLTVNATATVQRAPDVAVIHLAVETMAETAAEASDENAAVMDAVLAAVRAQGVPSSAIQTQRLELRPRYDNRRETAEPRITGYQAVNQVSIRLEDVELVGSIVDVGVRAGANRVTGIQFELAEPESAYHEALRQAIASARTEAEVAASALGMRLGTPMHVSTGGFRMPVQRARAETFAMDVAAAAPPVEPGELDVDASVSITWHLEP